ncbi:unnamed protein product [Gordionus sp. m RMFG-2023]
MIPAQDTFQQKDAENQQSNCRTENQDIRKKPDGDRNFCSSTENQDQSYLRQTTSKEITSSKYYIEQNHQRHDNNIFK